MGKCVFCSERKADTRDHVPPKGIFPKPRPSNLVTVPACAECNGNWSSLDEIFKLFVSLQAGMDGISESFLHNSVKRTIDHNQRLKKFLIEKSKMVEVRTPEGIIIGDLIRIPFPEKELKMMCQRIIMGLFYHHNQYTIPDNSMLSVYLPNDINEEVLNVIQHCHLEIIGDDREFIYCHCTANGSIFASTWILLFYKRFLAVGFIMPKE